MAEKEPRQLCLPLGDDRQLSLPITDSCGVGVWECEGGHLFVGTPRIESRPICPFCGSMQFTEETEAIRRRMMRKIAN